jgi:POT family proton-dependent oligopeptide transporter
MLLFWSCCKKVFILKLIYMFKGHPKGLYVAFFSNMGERFGYYTMIAIFVMFLQAKYGFDSSKALQIYGSFIACVYFLPLLGGLLADKFWGYGKTISLGLIIMFLGYLLLAIPTPIGSGLGMVIAALVVISLGTGFFKGNMQALVGNMYDDPRYSSKRDMAFSIFYMGINVGAMFAPTAAEMVSNFVLKTFHYSYDSRIPALAHSFLNGGMGDAQSYLSVAQQQDASVSMQTLGSFSSDYLNALSKAYHYSFGVACISLIVSMLIFWTLRKYYKTADVTEKQKEKSEELKSQVVVLSKEETKQRLIALGLVFFVVIFFWMSFHQNGACMTLFARDYTTPTVSKFTNLWFDLFGLLPIFISVLSIYYLVRKKSETRIRLIAAASAIVFAALAYLRFQSYGDVNPFTPQKFQHFNPFFIVALTSLVLALFSYMQKKGKEPSSPRKIAYGMLIAAVGFVVLAFGSVGLPSPHELNGQVAPDNSLVSPYWLIGTYFTLTIAELFLSPIGISFVSKVAPPQYKGLMQGGWFAATAIGNYLVGVVGGLWKSLDLWVFWTILVVCCLLSASFIFSIIKRLEKVAK